VWPQRTSVTRISNSESQVPENPVDHLRVEGLFMAILLASTIAIGGLLVSALAVLVVVPTVASLLEDASAALARRLRSLTATPDTAEDATS
jgi:hypothetical protein